MEKRLGTYNFYVESQLAYRSTIAYRLSYNPEAYEYYRKGKNQNLLKNILHFGASFGIGYTIGSVVFGGNNPQWTPGLIGLGAFVISIPLGEVADRNYRTALNIYNANRFNESSFHRQQRRIHFHFGVNTLGLIIN